MLAHFGKIVFGTILLTGCAQQAPTENAPDMGPMPVVAAFYDSGPIQRDAQWLSVWFTEDMAQALAANTDVDFDIRSWANDPEVDDIRYAVSEHPDGDADIVTRFTYPGVGGGMHMTWNMCRRDDGQWRIQDVKAQAVGDEANPVAEDEVALRPMLGLDPALPEACV